MLKEFKELTSYNLKNLIKFEFIFKLLTVVIFTPLFLGLFNLIMQLSGYSYLTKENCLNFLLNPLTIAMLIILFLLLTIYSIFDIGVIISLIDGSKQHKNILLKDALKFSWQRSIKVFKPQNILMVFFVIFLIPFLNMGIGINLISSIAIPEFIMDFIFSNTTLFILYVILVIFLLALFLRWIYSLHYYFLEDCSFKEAMRRSKNLSTKSHLKDLVKISLTQLGLSIIYLIFIILEIIIIVIINKIFNNVTILNSLLITIIWVVIAISFVIYAILSTAISYIILSILFYQHKKERKEEIVKLDWQEGRKKKRSSVYTILIIVALVGLSIFTNLVMKGKLNLNIEYLRTMEVTAHRGASVKYPENTMKAFIGAKELGADWIELDIQQTKDNYIIVSHDPNFKRTSGVNLNTWEANLEDILKLDVGSFKDEEFKGEKVPLFEDVVKWAKENNMKLNIELKPTGKEKDFEKKVVEIINKYHFENDCVITSQAYEVLENTKALSQNIKTVYVTALAYGNISELHAADYFSVEASSVTKTMVSKLHNEGKQIYAWTVNTEESINKMINLNVDNIITDDPVLAKELIYKSKTSNVISEVIKEIDKLF